ncbi:hypothetical protein IMSAG185_00014 [Lachnospiraceae bacterium]|nr:hypothetical protein IMSAG185_00014 [Lachnospiraceae bacterium]
MNILTELRKGLCFLVGRFVKFSCCNVSGQCNKWSIPQSMTEKKLCFRGFFLCWSLKVVFSGTFAAGIATSFTNVL